MLDETIHGSCVGYSAQEIYKELTPDEQALVDTEVEELLLELLENEIQYTHDLYDQIGLADEVINYVKYNGNRALQTRRQLILNMNQLTQSLKMPSTQLVRTMISSP